MIEGIYLDQVIESEETYTLKIKIPKSFYPFYKAIFENMQGLAENLSHKARQAEELKSEKKKKRQKELRQRDLQVKLEIRNLYNTKLKETASHFKAMKEVNSAYKDWQWVREEFHQETSTRLGRRILKLRDKGLSLARIAREIKCSEHYVIKFLKKQGQSDDKKMDRSLFVIPSGDEECIQAHP